MARPHRYASFALLVGSALASPALGQTTAPGQDTSLRLEQQLDRQGAKKEAETRAQADALDGAPSSIMIDGQTYAVGNTVDDVGRALYIATTRRQWPDVRRFLARYTAFADHDPLLVHYARGALARHCGRLAEAERDYRQLLAIRPDHLPGRLELARVLFENHKDKDARRAFEAIRAELLAGPEQGTTIAHTVDFFLAALAKRRAWQGNLAIGPGYSNNLNQSSASYTCLLAADDGACLIDRKVPDPIAAFGINVEGVLNGRIPTGGHGGIRARTLLFGDIYPGQHDFSQATLIARLGYDYRTAKDYVAISPSFDLGTLGSALLYRTWGINGEWTHNLSARAMVKVEGNYRRFDYRLSGFQAQDGDQGDLFLTGWYMLTKGLTLFGGPDFVDKAADDPVNAYRQWRARLGVSKSFGTGGSLLLLGAARRRYYRAYSALFEAKRSDREQAYTGIARFPALSLAGLVPELVVQHNRTTSNIDWLYSWHRTTASLRLSHAF